MSDHEYLSTACWHELHDECRRECKFCAAGCRCSCHAGECARCLHDRSWHDGTGDCPTFQPPAAQPPAPADDAAVTLDDLLDPHGPQCTYAKMFCTWLVSLDDAEDVLAREERRTVTLTEIIAGARHVLAAEQSDVPDTATVLAGLLRELIELEDSAAGGTTFAGRYADLRRRALEALAAQRKLVERGQGGGEG